jgi:hypothetical protein
MQKLTAKFPERQELVDFYDRITKQEHSGFNVSLTGKTLSGLSPNLQRTMSYQRTQNITPSKHAYQLMTVINYR